MSFTTVVRDDFRNVQRSFIVRGVIGVFVLIAALVFAAEIDIYDHAYRTLFDLAVVAFVVPLFIAPLTYLAVAGDRTSGTIKYFLGLPNSRLEYFLGKYVARVSIAVAAILLGTVVGFVIAVSTFAAGADPGRFLSFALVSSLYVLSIGSLFISLSAVTASRSRAMAAVFGAYFVLLPFWSGFLPVINLQSILDAMTTALGISLTESTTAIIVNLSPTSAYVQSTTIVYTGVLDQYQAFQGIHPDSTLLAHQPWFGVLVLLVWTTLVPLIAFLKFRVSELG